MKLCKYCTRQNFCGNEITQDYCTGYIPQTEATEWTVKDREADEQLQRWIDEHNRLKEKHTDGNT